MDMSRSDDAEVTAISRCHVRDSEPLGRRNDRRIGSAEGQIAIVGHELGDAQPVPRGDGLDDEGARGQVPEEAHLGHRSEAARDQMSHLGDDEGRDHQRPGMRL